MRLARLLHPTGRIARISLATAGAAALALTAATGAHAATTTPGTTSAPASTAAAAHPADDVTGFYAVNAPSTVDFRNSPNWNDVGDVGGFVDNDPMDLLCYSFGGPAGPYSNTLWYQALDEPTGAVGWINDHYLDTPGTAAAPEPQTSQTCQPTAGYGGEDDPYSPDFTALATAQWSNFPNGNYTAGFSFYDGDTINLGCYSYGNAYGPYNNTLWYSVYDVTRNEYGWISDHDLSTPGTAASPEPQTWECNPTYYY